MMKKPITLLVMLALFASLIPLVHAAAIGASPATMSFDVPQGGSVEKTLKISTNSPDYVDFTIKKLDNAVNFTTISPETGKMKSGEPGVIDVKVSVPKKTKLGTYKGTLSVRSVGTGSVTGGSGSVISTGVAVSVSINVVPAVAVSLGMPLIVTLVIAAIAAFGISWVAFKRKKQVR